MRGIRNRAFAEFFADLFAGELVAVVLCLGFLLFLAVLAAFGGWFLWSRKAAADAFRKKVADKRKKEAQQYKASKKTKEI